MSTSRVTPILIRLYRVGVLAIIVWLLHNQHQ